MNQEKIGKFIAESRKKKKMTQEELAEKLKINNRTISRWENGINMPDLSLFKPLCELLDISINDLLNGEVINNEDIGEITMKTIDYANNEIKNVQKRSKKKIILMIGTLIITLGIIFGISDYQKIKMGIEPNFMIRISDGSKQTQYYLGLGYMLERKVGVSYKEPLTNDIYIRFGLWIYTWNVNIINPSPEDLFLRSNNNEIKTNKGSYCWSKESVSVCADTVGPTDMQYNETLNVHSGDVISYKLNDSVIKKIELYSNNNLIENNIAYDDNTINISDLEDEYIMVIYITSKYGNGWYSFKLNIE